MSPCPVALFWPGSEFLSPMVFYIHYRAALERLITEFIDIEITVHSNPVYKRHWSNAVLTLVRRLRRRPNIKSALGQCIVFPGKLLHTVPVETRC